jgi:hypothetical protein
VCLSSHLSPLYTYLCLYNFRLHLCETHIRIKVHTHTRTHTCTHVHTCTYTCFTLQVIQEYVTPPGKSLSRDLTHQLNLIIDLLVKCRPLSVSMANTIRRLKMRIHSVSDAFLSFFPRNTMCLCMCVYMCVC